MCLRLRRSANDLSALLLFLVNLSALLLFLVTSAGDERRVITSDGIISPSPLSMLSSLDGTLYPLVLDVVGTHLIVHDPYGLSGALLRGDGGREERAR